MFTNLGIHRGPGTNPLGYQGMTVVHLIYLILKGLDEMLA